jgi:PAS domain S-box-containing protein
MIRPPDSGIPAQPPAALKGQAAKRMVLASLAVVLVASLAGAAAYETLVRNTARQEVRTIEAFYANKLREWDGEWSRQAARHKARMAFLDLAGSETDRWSRLYAYHVAQGEEQQFSNVFLFDANAKIIFWYGPDAKRLADLYASTKPREWLYDQRTNQLFRVYQEPLWLGPEGMGRVALLRLLDSGLLYLNTASRTDLRLEWEGRVVAESLRTSGLEAMAAAKRADAVIPWPGGRSPAPALKLSHMVELPVGAMEMAAGVAVLLGLQALAIWVVMGGWLVGVARRVTLLGQASRDFARDWAAGRRQPLEIDPLVEGRPDEVGEVAKSLKSLASAVALNDAQRQASQEEMRRLRNLLSSVVDSMPSALITVDAGARVSLCNRLALESAGVAGAQAMGRSLEEAFPRLAGVAGHLRAAMAQGKVWTGHKMPVNVDGEIRYEDVTVYPLAGDSQTGAVIRVDDVTGRQRIEQMIIQSEKMLSVGGLAAGMAHEINNPLGGILQSSQVVLRRVDPENEANRQAALAAGCPIESIREYLERRGVMPMLDGIRESARRAATIVADMLEFSRRGEAPHEPVSLAELLEKAVELSSKDYDLKRRFDFRKIGIERDIARDLPPVRCFASQIEQVVMNLLRNAAQAMSGNPPGRPPVIRLSARREEGHVVIQVEDNGPGLDEQAQKRVFEPFYTTKAPGSGTGLGLSVSYFIVTENHGGSMSVESKPGEWTRFTIRLPVTGERDPLPAGAV